MRSGARPDSRWCGRTLAACGKDSGRNGTRAQVARQPSPAPQSLLDLGLLADIFDQHHVAGLNSSTEG